MLRTIACGVFLTAAGAVLAGGAAEKAGLGQAAELFRQLRDAETAKKADAVKTLLPRFTATVQAAAPALPEVPAEGAAKPKAYHKVTLNAGPARVDGFRFRVPEGKGGWNLSWEYVAPQQAGQWNWNIVAREGTVEGFKRFDKKENHAEKGAALPPENHRYTQRLTGGKLRSGAEYIIWFAFEDDRPVDLHVRLGLTPHGK
jgi:hypothetical protein